MAPLRSSPVVPFSPFSSPSPFRLSSPLQSSSDQYRVWEVETVTSTGRSRGSAKLWVYHGETFVAKVSNNNNVRAPNSAWKRKFVFAVTDDFLSDDDSSLLIDIYGSRGGSLLGIITGRRKKYLGTARCCIKNGVTGIEDEAGGGGGRDVAFCSLPVVLNGVSSLNLEVKLRLWKEVLQKIHASEF